ncbi:50S ribosomal protein L25 [Cohnella sp. CFH 77786]|uniref:50S ribosomal protein L25 n=1 Tax=Cohnella sp. CFH 77786 TaxID=2662265 RepID=UPI0021024946|nr:50S ribosomal protein L25 [Cohnella sp. CFH 77786]
MNPMTLKAERRQTASRGELRKLRKHGRVPGVIYGKGVEGAMPVAVDVKDLQMLLSTHPHAVLELDVAGLGKENVLMSDVQRDSMSRDVLHVDFHKINLNESIKAPVRLEVSGKSAGEREGGLLQLVLHEMEVECLPKDLPDSIVLEIDNLLVGDTLTVADIRFPEGVMPTMDPDTVVAAILAPQKEMSAEEADAAGDAAEENESQAKTAARVE